jgi:hypothetical protein
MAQANEHACAISFVRPVISNDAQVKARKLVLLWK